MPATYEGNLIMFIYLILEQVSLNLTYSVLFTKVFIQIIYYIYI